MTHVKHSVTQGGFHLPPTRQLGESLCISYQCSWNASAVQRLMPEWRTLIRRCRQPLHITDTRYYCWSFTSSDCNSCTPARRVKWIAVHFCHMRLC